MAEGGVSTDVAGALRRRDLLKKGAVAGGIVWAAPVIMSSPAFAAGTVGSDLCFCPNGDRSGVRVATITFQWTPGVCGPDTDRCVGPDGAMNNASCSGSSAGWASATVTSISGKGKLTSNGVTGSPVAPGGQFTLSGITPPEVNITLTQTGGSAKQLISVHTSCSQPICFGDRYGSLTVVSYTVTGTPKC